MRINFKERYKLHLFGITAVSEPETSVLVLLLNTREVCVAGSTRLGLTREGLSGTGSGKEHGTHGWEQITLHGYCLKLLWHFILKSFKSISLPVLINFLLNILLTSCFRQIQGYT